MKGVALEEGILPSRVYVEFGELPSKYKKAVDSIVKELGFSLSEIGELVIIITSSSGVLTELNKKEDKST